MGKWAAKRTGSQSALVNPRVHLAALALQLVHKSLQLAQLHLQLLDLVGVRAQGLVEGARQRVRRGLHLERAGAHGVEGVRVLARAETIALVRVDVLRAVGSRIHVFGVFLCGRGGAEVVVLLQVGLVEGDGDGLWDCAGAGAVLALRARPVEVGVVGVRVCSGTARQTLEEHGEEEAANSGGATLIQRRRRSGSEEAGGG